MTAPDATSPASQDPAAVDHMVSRFLAWRLPENFNPDNGISFKAEFNEHTAHPMRCNPTGTNLFDRTQAEAMVRHMLEGLPEMSASSEPEYASGCGYTGPDFGAPHNDSTCIDGFLWDLDSCDDPGGGLTQGGDIPCPSCNSEGLQQAAQPDPSQPGMSEANAVPSLLIDQEWLNRRIASDPDLPCEAGGPPLPAVHSGAVAWRPTRDQVAEAIERANNMDVAVDNVLALAPLPGGVGEAITTAAVRSGELIVTIERPGRHGDCINFLHRYGLDYMDQGFLTTHGRFVDRIEGGKIAVAAGQGAPRPQCNGNIFSEDIWPEPRVSAL